MLAFLGALAARAGGARTIMGAIRAAFRGAGDGRHRGYRESVRDRCVSGALAKLREGVYEVRAGLTWSFSVRNNKQFMSEPEPEVNFAANPVDLIRHLLTNLPTNCKY